MQITNWSKQIQLSLFPVLILIPTLAATSIMPAVGMYAPLLTESVPVQRLLTNLEIKAHAPGLSNKDVAALEYQIGRLHSMAYARKTEMAQVRKPKPDKNDETDALPIYGVGPAASSNLMSVSLATQLQENPPQITLI